MTVLSRTWKKSPMGLAGIEEERTIYLREEMRKWMQMKGYKLVNGLKKLYQRLPLSLYHKARKKRTVNKIKKQ